MAKTFFKSQPFGTIKNSSHVEQKLDATVDISLYLFMFKLKLTESLKIHDF